MKKIILSLLLLSAFTFCKKTKISDPSVEPVPTEQPDNIEYKTLEPGINLTSSNGTTSKYQNASGIRDLVLPIDTTAKDSVTIEKFSHFQFRLVARNYEDKTGTYTPSSSHLRYNNFIQIRCASVGDSIIKPSRTRPAASLLSEGNLIGPGMIGDGAAYIHSVGGPYGDVYNTSFPTGEHYLGFKTTRDGKSYYGWIKVESFGSNGIKVKEIAINKTANKSILCGQKK